MALSVIIVNFKSAQLQIDCLTEIYKDPIASTFEMIMVDNNSGDDSRQRITTAFPQVKWIQMDSNAGFARANNEGLKHATGDTMLLLNGDTLPAGKDIEECYQRLRRSEYIAAGIQLLSVDGSPQISGMYVKWIADLAKVKKPHVPGKGAIVEVDWINGAFLMVKQGSIDKVGPLDNDFFLYAEEAEWCGRLRKTGKMVLYGDLEVTHLQGVTANLAFGSDGKGYVNIYDRKGLQLMLSNFVRLRKEFGIGWFLFQLLIYIAEIPVFFLGVLFSGLFGKRTYSWTVFRQYCKNVGIVIGKSGKIIRNKPYFYKVI
jgi:GT2 family glycosyltransferase